MTFTERYQIADTWQDKVIIMRLYHTAATAKHRNWTISHTAQVFDVSIGLVSENLRLATELDNNPRIANCSTRQEALNKIERRKVVR